MPYIIHVVCLRGDGVVLALALRWAAAGLDGKTASFATGSHRRETSRRQTRDGCCFFFVGIPKAYMYRPICVVSVASRQNLIQPYIFKENKRGVHMKCVSCFSQYSVATIGIISFGTVEFE